MTTKTTKVRLFAGAEPLVIADAKLYTPGAHMHPVEMYQSSAMEAEDGALYKNQWNRIMQYRASDSKWFCTHCNLFCWLMKDVQKAHGQILTAHRCVGTVHNWNKGTRVKGGRKAISAARAAAQ